MKIVISELDQIEAIKYKETGDKYYQKENFSDALQYYNYALNKNPSYGRAWNNKALVLQAQGKYLKAIFCHENAIQFEPRLAVLRYNKGLAFEALGNTVQAIDCYNQALHIDPQLSIAIEKKAALTKQTPLIKRFDLIFNEIIEVVNKADKEELMLMAKIFSNNSYLLNKVDTVRGISPFSFFSDTEQGRGILEQSSELKDIISAEALHNTSTVLDIHLHKPSMKSNPSYKQFAERISLLLKQNYKERPSFLHKAKVVAKAGIPLVITVGVANSKKETNATFAENQIIIYPENCYTKDDAAISSILIHEFEHAYTHVIHQIRWQAEKNEMPDKYKKLEDPHCLPFFPYNEKEKEKYEKLIKIGKDRVFDFAELLQKSSKKENMSAAEYERLEKYKLAAKEHIEIRHYNILKSEDEKKLTTINLQSVKPGLSYYYVHNENKYHVSLIIDSITKSNETGKFIASGYYRFLLNDSLPKGEEINYHAFIGEVLSREEQITTGGYQEEERIIEYQARTFSELTESELFCFYPELIQYETLDAEHAMISSQKQHVVICPKSQESENAELYKNYPNIPNASFALTIQGFFKKKNIEVSVKTYLQSPTKEKSDLDAYTVDVVCRTSTEENFKNIKFFLQPIAQRVELSPATKEIIIKSTNVETEVLHSFANNLDF